MKRIVAVTGGIGAGKSVVCHSLRALGYPVYDCDSEARRLMNSDKAMQARIVAEVTPKALNADGTLCRPAISACVFADTAKLQVLNSIVHGAVRADFLRWADSHGSSPLFVETAILYESGFDALVSEVWEVTAPAELRIARVERRSGLSREEITRRIAAQSSESRPSHRIIINDGITPVLSRILSLLSRP